MVDQFHDGAYSARRSTPKAPVWMQRAAKAALGFVYPALCPVCRTETAATGGLCAECWGAVTFISGTVCATCGAPMASGGSKNERLICDGCAHAPPAWSSGASAVVYEGAGRKLILMFKHGDRLDIAPIAAHWMQRAGSELIESADVIVPVPLHWKRLAKRRYNQAGELAREIAISVGRPESCALDLIRRKRPTDSMDGKTRSQRMQVVMDAFVLAPFADLRGKTVLLVDDVMTTGATLSACTEVCRAAGAADVNALVFARVARDDWPA